MKKVVFSIIMPLLILSSFVGSGLALWYFDEENILNQEYSQVVTATIEKYATIGTITADETISYLILDQEGARLINQFSVNYQPPSGNYLEENINFNFTYQVNIVSPLADYIYLENHNDGNRIENIDGSYTISYQGD